MDNQQKKEVAKALFLNTEKTQKDICEIVGWTEKTFSEVKQKYRWGELKDNKSLTRQQIITMMHAQTLKMMKAAEEEDRILKTNEVDCVAKLTASIDKLEKRATIETIIEVFEEYNNWLLGLNVALAQENNKWQDRYVMGKVNEQS